MPPARPVVVWPVVVTRGQNYTLRVLGRGSTSGGGHALFWVVLSYQATVLTLSGKPSMGN